MNTTPDPQSTPIAVNINFDSLGEALGYPANYRDPSFFAIADRFFSAAERYGFKYSIYIIGKDLENPEIFDRVRDWHQAGHEIGNHTWSHPMNLGGLPADGVRREIESAHEIITRCIDCAPKGFIAPAWSSGKKVIATLIDLDYDYDTSVFPSHLLLPMVAKIAWNHRKIPAQFKRVVGRADWVLQARMPRHPLVVDRQSRACKADAPDSLVLLPLPTRNRLSFPFWHTLYYLFAPDRIDRQLEQHLASHPAFYYLLHPADLAAPDDIGPEHQSALERMEHTLAHKEAIFDRAMERLQASGRPFVLMRDLAAQVRSG